MSLTLPQRIADEIIAQARGESPHECCGFLAGNGSVVTHRLPLVNSAESPLTRFESSPESTFLADKEMRRLGVEALAVYHSHPHGPPIPSATDREWNYSANVINLIVSLAMEPPELRAWRIDGDTIAEVMIS